MLQQQKDNSRIFTFVKLFFTIGLLKPLTILLFVLSMLSTPQALHKSRIFHIGTPAKVVMRETHTHIERDPHIELEET
jgi:hypothetical protein